MKSIVDRASELMVIVGTELETITYSQLGHAIIDAFEAHEEEIRAKCADMIMDCKNHTIELKSGYVDSLEAYEKIINSRDSKIGDYV